MKGIILHGGYGTRLGPLTFSRPKQLLPIANKPMSQYALDDLKKCGITEIAIVIGDVYPEKVKNFYGDGSNFGVNISYVYQEKPLGISHAIKLCKDFVKGDKFVVYLGDNILRKNLVSFVNDFEKLNIDFQILLSEVMEPQKFGIAEFKNNKLSKIIEKPKTSNSNLAVIGIYFLTPKIFDIIENLKPSWRGELEITDALQIALENNFSFKYQIVTGWWKDTGTPEDILDANQLILQTLGSNELINLHEVKNNKKISIGKNSKIDSKTIIHEPVIIGDNCFIKSSEIGPNVSIGDNARILDGHISNSIIMDNCVLQTKLILKNCIIAYDSEILDSTNNTGSFLLGEKNKIRV